MARSDPDTRGRAETVLLLGNYRPTLTLARVLSRRGHRVISGLQGCDGGAEHSRFVTRIWDHPRLPDDPEAFAAALKGFVKTNSVSIVFPVSEDFVRFFADHPKACPDGAVIAMVDPQLAGKCLDKMYMMKLARAHQVPTAPFAFAAGLPDTTQAVRQTGFPLVIRPEDSTRRLNGKKALFIADAGELRGQLSAWPTGQGGLIFQKKATGRRHNIYFAASKGRVFRYLNAMILRTDNPDGSGLAVKGVTIPPVPELRTHTESLVAALDYSGIGCAQYLVDEAAGSISFLEINARIAGNHALPEFAGLKLSSLLVDMAAGRRIDTTPIEGKQHIRYVWTRGDIEAVKIAWMGAEIGHWQAIVQALRAVKAALRADLHMTFSWSDPLPGLMALKGLLPNGRKLIPNLRQRLWLRPNAARSSSKMKAPL